VTPTLDERRPSVFRRWPVVWAALAYLLVGTVVLWPSIRPGRTLVAADLLVLHPPYSELPAPPVHNLLLSDTPVQFFPWLSFTGQALRARTVPQWNPTLLGGIPVTPNGFVNVYYPPTWLTVVLAPFDAYNAFVLLHLVLGALGVYVFARTLGARPLPAWIGGLLVFSAQFWIHWSTHLLHIAGMVWLPWALAATTVLVKRPSPRRAAALALVFGLWWLGANPQYAYYGTLTMGAWAAALLVHRKLSSSGRVLPAAAAFAGAVVLGAALAAPILLPTASRSTEIVREGVKEAATDHLPREQAIRLLVPDAFGNAREGIYFRYDIEREMDSPFMGVSAVLLAAAAIASRDRRAWILLAGAGAVLVIAFTGLPHRIFFAVLPGYDRFRVNARWLSVLPALVAPLAAVGLDRLLDSSRRAGRSLLATGLLAVAAVAGWFLWVRTVAEADTAEDYFWERAVIVVAFVAVVVIAGRLLSRWPRAALGVLAVVIMAEISQVPTEWYPRVAEGDAYPPVAIGQVAEARGGRLIHVGPRTQFPPYAPNLPMVAGGDDSQGQSVLFPKDYDRYLRLVDDYGDLVEAVNNAPPLADAGLLGSRLLDVLDVRTVIAPREVAVPPQYPPLVVGSANAYGRASLGPAVLVPAAAPATEDEMWRRVADPAWDPAATASVLGLRQAVGGSPGTVSGGPSGRPEHEVWEVDSAGGGFLRISGNWDEGWSARVDGRRQPVLRADGVFRGVVVPAGPHRVEFNYSNVDEGRGRVVAGVAVAILAALALARRRRVPDFPDGNGPLERAPA
jgi:hypothetical protein